MRALKTVTVLSFESKLTPKYAKYARCEFVLFVTYRIGLTHVSKTVPLLFIE